MTITNLAKALRDLADRVEQFDLPPEHRCSIELEVDGVETREDLATWAAFAGEPLTVCNSENNSWLRRYTGIGGECPFGFCAFFTKGLLGGETVQVVKDDPKGLETLLAEHRAAEMVQA